MYVYVCICIYVYVYVCIANQRLGVSEFLRHEQLFLLLGFHRMKQHLTLNDN